jgi:hypothetical protein
VSCDYSRFWTESALATIIVAQNPTEFKRCHRIETETNKSARRADAPKTLRAHSFLRGKPRDEVAKRSKQSSNVRPGVPAPVPARTCVCFCVLFCKLFARPSLGLPGGSLTCVRGPWPVVCQGLPARVCSLPAIRIAPARFPTTGQGHALATRRICAEASACFARRSRGVKLPPPARCVFCVLYVVWIKWPLQLAFRK